MRLLGKIAWLKREKEVAPPEGGPLWGLAAGSEFDRQQAEQRSADLRRPIHVNDSIPIVIAKIRLQDEIKHEFDPPEPYEMIDHLLPSRRRRRRD